MSGGPGQGSPGAQLRAAREGLGLSIEEVADRLRLNEALVLAIEENRFGLLGAPVFARGHLRAYAALVGAVEREVLDAFDVGDLPEPTLLKVGDHVPELRSRGRARRFAVILSLAALAAAAGVFAWWRMRG
ncbi:MAG: helix-turn-helix domain-containing protein [Gammaproteobacteria bacterium]|nr:helix-turn-helix domain-containing protein [Gammaproteobacteria bacterium]